MEKRKGGREGGRKKGGERKERREVRGNGYLIDTWRTEGEQGEPEVRLLC
jgi:hypothetical protein